MIGGQNDRADDGGAKGSSPNQERKMDMAENAGYGNKDTRRQA
jgi:hypothetical protein